LAPTAFSTSLGPAAVLVLFSSHPASTHSVTPRFSGEFLFTRATWDLRWRDEHHRQRVIPRRQRGRARHSNWSLAGGEASRGFERSPIALECMLTRPSTWCPAIGKKSSTRVVSAKWSRSYRRCGILTGISTWRASADSRRLGLHCLPLGRNIFTMHRVPFDICGGARQVHGPYSFNLDVADGIATVTFVVPPVTRKPAHRARLIRVSMRSATARYPVAILHGDGQHVLRRRRPQRSWVDLVHDPGDLCPPHSALVREFSSDDCTKPVIAAVNGRRSAPACAHARPAHHYLVRYGLFLMPRQCRACERGAFLMGTWAARAARHVSTGRAAGCGASTAGRGSRPARRARSSWRPRSTSRARSPRKVPLAILHIKLAADTIEDFRCATPPF